MDRVGGGGARRCSPSLVRTSQVARRSARDARRRDEPIDPTEAAETFRERRAFHVYASVAWLGRTLPTQTGRALFRLFGTLALPHRLSERAPVVAANQAQVLGRPVDDPLVVASHARGVPLLRALLVDTSALPRWSDEEIVPRFDWDGDRPAGADLAAGRG